MTASKNTATFLSSEQQGHVRLPEKRQGKTMVIVLMGVSGSGKTTVGRLLSEEVGWKYSEADDYHSRANIEKRRRRVPLDDADRWPWLETLRHLIRDCLERN